LQAEKKFNTNVAQLKLYYAPHDYEWLPTPKIPKKLDGAVDPEHLKSLEVNCASSFPIFPTILIRFLLSQFKPTLLEVYVSLQKIAVGVEQMVWDEEDRNGPLKSSLIETENYLGSLLCEIHTAIIEKELTVEETVTRDIHEGRAPKKFGQHRQKHQRLDHLQRLSQHAPVHHSGI
jgi:hypothetical protein